MISQNKIWVFENEDASIAVRKSRSRKKKVIVVFFKLIRIVHRFVLNIQKTVTDKRYTQQRPNKFLESFKNLKPYLIIDS